LNRLNFRQCRVTISKQKEIAMPQRRTVLTQLIAVALLTACQSARLTPLREEDVTAQSAGFKLRAEQVDPMRSPSYRKGQVCANCRFSRTVEAQNLGCEMFPGRSVPVNAWCEHFEANQA
jgi:hypothetical protein